MDLFEYQAKALFAEYGVPVPQGKVASTPEEVRAIAEEFAAAGKPRVVVKAQVKTGGRGKAGGVKVADGPDDAVAKAKQILGMDIKGHTVHRVLVEEASDIAEEYYFSFLLDRANRSFLSICSAEGGMEIEEVAATNPEAVAKVPISPLKGAPIDVAADIVAKGKLPEAAAQGAVDVITKLWNVFVAKDATLVEVNPLILTKDGRVVALDGKVTLDDNAEFRQDLASLASAAEGDHWKSRPRRRASTTSNSTVRWASSATALGSSCPRWTWSPTPASSTAGLSPLTSLTSAAAHLLRSWPTAWRSF